MAICQSIEDSVSGIHGSRVHVSVYLLRTIKDSLGHTVGRVELALDRRKIRFALSSPLVNSGALFGQKIVVIGVDTLANLQK